LLLRRDDKRRTVHEYFGLASRGLRNLELPVRGDLIRSDKRLLAQFLLDVEQGRIRAASYKCTTCVTLMAYCELLAEALEGASLGEVMKLTPMELIVAVPGVPPNRHDRARLAVKAVRSAAERAGQGHIE
jgi:hypothetical protein